MVQPASIYPKDTDASAPRDIRVLIVKKKDRTAEMTLAQQELCAKMNPDTTTTHVCAGLDIQELTVMLL